MRTAKCCIEQGIHDHFGCDLSDSEAIFCPGCPENSQKVLKSPKLMQTKKMRTGENAAKNGVFMTILDAICVT